MLRSHFIAKYFHPFIDTIHRPYKDNLKCWFGVRLFVPSLIYITTAVLEGSNLTLQFLLLIQIILESFTIAQPVVHHTRRKCHTKEIIYYYIRDFQIISRDWGATIIFTVVLKIFRITSWFCDNRLASSNLVFTLSSLN